MRWLRLIIERSWFWSCYSFFRLASIFSVVKMRMYSNLSTDIRLWMNLYVILMIKEIFIDNSVRCALIMIVINTKAVTKRMKFSSIRLDCGWDWFFRTTSLYSVVPPGCNHECNSRRLYHFPESYCLLCVTSMFSFKVINIVHKVFFILYNTNEKKESSHRA